MLTRNYTLPILVAATVAASGCGGGGATSKKNVGGGGSPIVSGASGTIVPVGNLATGRVGHTSTYLKVRVNNVDQEMVVVIGGKGRAGTTDTVLDSAEIFDLKTGQFAPAQGRLSGAQQTGANGRMNHTAIALPNGKILVVGGHTDVAGANALNSAEVFNGLSAMAQFSRAGGTLTHAKAEPVVFLYNPPNGTGTPEVAIAGGRQRSGSADVALSSVDFYKPDSNTIVTKNPLNNTQTITMRQARWGAEAAALSSSNDAEWVISGGISGTTVAGFEIFDPAQRTFNQTSKAAPGSTNASLIRNRALHGSALLGSQVAAIGGRDGATGGAAIDTVELYDPATNQWAPITARLGDARFGHTATRLKSGEIVLIGGQSSTNPALGSIEVVSGSGIGATVTRLSQTLRTPRRNHTATYFESNGVEQILIAGGEDASGTPLASAEIFVLGSASSIPVLPPIGGNGLAPVINTLTPASGPVGTQVTITGNNFSLTASQNIVKFNGIVAPVQSAASSTTTQGAIDLRVAVPQGATTGDVTVAVGGQVSAGKLFTISSSTGTSTGTGGNQFSGPPRIFILLPTAGPSFMPLGIGGSNFDVGTIPYVNGTPSISLFNFSTRSLPLIGSISVGFTIVPPGAPAGSGDVVVEYIQQRSNPFPFTKN